MKQGIRGKQDVDAYSRVDPPLRAPRNPRHVRSDLPLLEAVISGGQTGVDQAALRAVTRLGLATGGWAPKGWRTLDGPAPWLADFGLTELGREDYPARTAKCVHASDAVLRLAWDWMSLGEICTFRAIEKYEKPHLDATPIGLLPNQPYCTIGFQSYNQESAALRVAAFLIQQRVHVLCVAGNSEQTSPGIGRVAEDFLVRTLEETR